MIQRNITIGIALAFLIFLGTISASALSPVLECVQVRSSDDCTAVWGYNNPPNDFVPFEPIGSNNRFIPTPQDRGQPEEFLAGRQVCAFTVDFNCNNLVWRLDNRTSTANGGSSQCSPGCLPCGPGGDEVIVEPFSSASGEEACTTSVPNVEVASGTFAGCSVNNIIGTCLVQSETQEEYDACVLEASTVLAEEGDISGSDSIQIDSCVTGVVTRNIPTLSEWGMIAIAAFLGLAGLIAVRRKAAA